MLILKLKCRTMWPCFKHANRVISEKHLCLLKFLCEILWIITRIIVCLFNLRCRAVDWMEMDLSQIESIRSQNASYSTVYRLQNVFFNESAISRLSTPNHRPLTTFQFLNIFHQKITKHDVALADYRSFYIHTKILSAFGVRESVHMRTEFDRGCTEYSVSLLKWNRATEMIKREVSLSILHWWIQIVYSVIHIALWSRKRTNMIQLVEHC